MLHLNPTNIRSATSLHPKINKTFLCSLYFSIFILLNSFEALSLKQQLPDQLLDEPYSGGLIIGFTIFE
jgi:hypothetical protein